MPTAIEPAIKHLVEIDKKIDKNESAALRLRWEFGNAMLAERDGKQLPKGRLDKLIEATGKSKSELGYRMRFAARYPTDDEVTNALATFTSWRELIKSFSAGSDNGEAKPSKERLSAGRLVGAAEAVLAAAVEGRIEQDDMQPIYKALDTAEDAIVKARAAMDKAINEAEGRHPGGKRMEKASVA